jgi:hypothetical protein
MNGRCLVILAAVVLSILQEQRQVEGISVTELRKLIKVSPKLNLFSTVTKPVSVGTFKPAVTPAQTGMQFAGSMALESKVLYPDITAIHQNINDKKIPPYMFQVAKQFWPYYFKALNLPTPKAVSFEESLKSVKEGITGRYDCFVDFSPEQKQSDILADFKYTTLAGPMSPGYAFQLLEYQKLLGNTDPTRLMLMVLRSKENHETEMDVLEYVPNKEFFEKFMKATSGEEEVALFNEEYKKKRRSFISRLRW